MQLKEGVLRSKDFLRDRLNFRIRLQGRDISLIFNQMIGGNGMAKDKKKEKIYFTIAGMQHYYGMDCVKKNMEVKLVKEPDNEYDSEAIRVEFEGLGKAGYVANSPYTVLGEN